MMGNETLPIPEQLVRDALAASSADNLNTASIREVVGVVRFIEKKKKVNFLRMDMGIPGLPTPKIGTNAQVKALKSGKSALYAQIDGLPELKHALSDFGKNFLNIKIDPLCCLVTAGSMMASMITFLIAARRYPDQQGVLFIDPGFSVQKKQAQVAGVPQFSFDIYNYRGKKLRKKLKEVCVKNKISVIVYSNPNNPAWICLTHEELQIIGELATEHNIIVAEDLAYFGMDYRYNYSIPGKEPYQPSVAHYTKNYIILFSSSKVFSFAGERVGALMISNHLFHQKFPNLLNIGNNEILGHAMIQDGIYVLSAGTSHSGQHGLLAMLDAANKGTFNFLQYIHAYADRAKFMKFLFLKYGFYIVYDKDGDADLADGFYFTVCYKNLDTETLMLKLLQCGISTISLQITGSTKEGVRISVSMIELSNYDTMETRLKIFKTLV